MSKLFQIPRPSEDKMCFGELADEPLKNGCDTSLKCNIKPRLRHRQMRMFGLNLAR